MTTVKNIFKIVVALVIAIVMVGLFVMLTLPAINQDRSQMVEQEMDAHNKTLEAIKQDFSYVLSAENVSVEMGKTINLTISGKNCHLNVELNRELKVLTLETIDKTEEVSVGLGFACFGEAVGLIFAIGLFLHAIGSIAQDIRHARTIRREIKQAKKESVDVKILV